MKNILTFLLLSILPALSLGGFATASAQSIKQRIHQNPYSAGSNYVAYPGPKQALSPTPDGYEPYYLSHYGRHGSRYHIGSVYTNTEKLFAKADSEGVLTPLGKDVYHRVQLLREEASGRDGELTPLGALQHQQIAERMYRNFPEIFAKETNIDAKSTIVIRCILSMENALQQLVRLNPKLHITHDASNHDMYYMNQPDAHLDSLKRVKNNVLHEFQASHTHPERLMPLLFNDDSYWQKKINAKSLMRDLFALAMNVQSSEIRHRLILTDLFTEEEIYDLYQCDNAFWYIAYGPSKLSGGVQPFSQRNLLRKIISEADSCLVLDNPGATLRYGHDTMVMPLTCLLECDNTAQQIADLNSLTMHEWNNVDIFPMACNLQFVFYRPKNGKTGDILVKVLRNENETHLPVTTTQWPYYRWQDFKDYYLKKLDSYK